MQTFPLAVLRYLYLTAAIQEHRDESCGPDEGESGVAGEHPTFVIVPVNLAANNVTFITSIGRTECPRELVAARLKKRSSPTALVRTLEAYLAEAFRPRDAN